MDLKCPGIKYSGMNMGTVAERKVIKIIVKKESNH